MTHNPRIAIYPGTFDPITNGHLDIIGRAAKLFDHLVIGVATNEAKGPILALAERLELVALETAPLAHATGCTIEPAPMRGLLVEFARAQGAATIIRGLRSVTDYDYEAQMTGMNRRMAPEIDTLFLLAGAEHQSVSSSLVRQIAQFGGDIASFVPPTTQSRVLARLRR